MLQTHIKYIIALARSHNPLSMHQGRSHTQCCAECPGHLFSLKWLRHGHCDLVEVGRRLFPASLAILRICRLHVALAKIVPRLSSIGEELCFHLHCQGKALTRGSGKAQKEAVWLL